MKHNLRNLFIKIFEYNRFFPLFNSGKRWYATHRSNRLQKEACGMASIFDVAKYILHHAGKMTTMKLEKLMYYSQAWSLAWDEGTPLFDDDFEAWANGPVCPELFSTHQGQYELPVEYYDAKGNTDNLTKDQRDTIDTVLKAYGDKSAQWLSNLTHKELPWREARQGIPAGMRCDHIIAKDSIQEYYGGLQ